MKVVYILSQVSKAVAFEWIARDLPKKGVDVSFILIGNQAVTPLSKYLDELGIESRFVKLGSKLNWFFSFLNTMKELRKMRPEIVHAHLFEGSLIGLAAAKFLGIQNRIYTRHHATFHHDFFPKAVKYDKMINAMATRIVAISPNVQKVLISKEGVDPKKVQLIPHGFELSKFQNADEEAVSAMRTKYNLKDEYPAIGCIARYIELKGVIYIIQAFKRFLDEQPNAVLMLFNAGGPFEKEVRKVLQTIDPKSYREIGFEEDLFSVYQLLDIYVHVPIDEHIEAFGQTYVEALASKVPSIFTLSGIAKELIKDGKNALVVPYKDSEAIYQSMVRLTNDKELREDLKEQGIQSVQPYSLDRFINSLSELYHSVDQIKLIEEEKP